MKRLILVLMLLLAAAACAATQGTSGPRTQTRSDRLTQDEIEDSGLTNMYEVIQRLRPGWLRRHQKLGVSWDVGVFMDGARVGEADFLRQIPASQVGDARYLTNAYVEVELSNIQQDGLGTAIMLTSIRARP